MRPSSRTNQYKGAYPMTSATSSLPGRRGLPRPRALGILAAAMLVVAITYVWTAARPVAPTSQARPVAPATIDSTGGAAALIGGSTAQIDQAIKVWSANLAKEPRDFISATTLASLYYARGRLSGDLADEQRALQFSQTAVATAPTEAGGRGSRPRSLTTSTTSLVPRPRHRRSMPTTRPNSGALATMADATLELGDIAGARSDYDKLSSSPRAPPSISAWPGWPS